MFACTEGNFSSFGPTGNSTSTVQKKRFFQANKSVHQFVYRMNMQIYADYARHWREKWGRNDNSGSMKVHRQILTQITKQPTSVASQLNHNNSNWSRNNVKSHIHKPWAYTTL